MGDGVPCYGALEIVGLLLLLLLLLTATFDILKYCIFVLILLNCSLFLAHVISNLMHSSQVLTADNFIITDPFKWNCRICSKEASIISNHNSPLRIGIIVAVLNLVALVVHFCVDKFIVNQLPWDHAYIQDFVSFVIISITILVIAIPEGLPVAVMVSLAYSVKVRSSRDLFLSGPNLGGSRGPWLRAPIPGGAPPK